jgi:hypothetical protein
MFDNRCVAARRRRIILRTGRDVVLEIVERMKTTTLFASAALAAMFLAGCPGKKDEKKVDPQAKVIDEAKPTEAKPTEAKPTEAKPDETKSEAKPDETKKEEPKKEEAKKEEAKEAPKPEPAK